MKNTTENFQRKSNTERVCGVINRAICKNKYLVIFNKKKILKLPKKNSSPTKKMNQNDVRFLKSNIRGRKQ